MYKQTVSLHPLITPYAYLYPLIIPTHHNRDSPSYLCLAFVLPPPPQGYNDRSLLEQLRRAYTCAHPPLATHETLHTLPIPHDLPRDVVQNILLDKPTGQFLDHTTGMNAGVKAGEKGVATAKKIRVGFVSSHLRRHSICKLFCGLFLRLDRRVFEVVVFAALAESKHTPFNTPSNTPSCYTL